MKQSNLFRIPLIPWLQKEKKKYVFVIILVGLGIGSGMVAVFISSPQTLLHTKTYFDQFLSAYTLQECSNHEAFLLSLWNHALLFFWMWCSGWVVWLLPLGLFQLFLKGFRFGFSLTSLLYCYGAKGSLLAFLTLIPQNLILMPLLCIFMVTQMNYASTRQHIRLLPSIPFRPDQHSILCMLTLLLMALCALIEGYLIPSFMQPFGGFFL